MKNLTDKRVLVVFGGASCEHDISIITGVLTLNSVDRTKYLPVPLYIRDGRFYTGDALFDLGFFKSFDASLVTPAVLTVQDKFLYAVKGSKLKRLCRIYCAVNCCHGLNGEDGCISALAQMSGIPFASPDIMCSSVFMDKAATKHYLEGIGVKTLPFRILTKAAFYQNRVLAMTLCEHSVGYPCIVKPSRLGSSIGISVANCRRELTAAIESALRFDQRLIVEKALEDFKEVNCAAYKTCGRVVTSECESPVAQGKILSFADKYCSGGKGMAGAEREFPAVIPEEVEKKIKDTTSLVYRKSFATGVVRMDYLVSGDEVYLNEVNTVPGSLALYLFKDSSSQFGEVLSELIEEGVKARRDFDNGTFTYSADVLSSVGSKSGTKGARRG